MVRTRLLRVWLWSVGLFLGVIFAFQDTACRPAAAPPAARIVVPDDYPTVQAAIDATQAGDTVYLKAGTYHEALALKSGIKLLGEQRDSVILQFDGSKSVITVRDCNDVSISSVTVRPMTMSHGLGQPAGVVVDNSTVILAQCRIAEAAGNGLDIGRQANAAVNSCLIEGNGARGIEVRNSRATIHACEVARNQVLGIVLIGPLTTAQVRACRISESRFAGLGVWLGAGGTIEENDLQNNDVGIDVRDVHTDVTVSKNHCRSNQRTGIQIYAGARARAEENLCEENRGQGIVVCGKNTRAIVERNRCLRNGERGILVHTFGTGVLTGNECVENKKDGIYLNVTEAEIAVEGNSCRDNQQVGIAVYATAGGRIAHNLCQSNGRFGIYVRKTTSPVTACANRCMWNQEDGIAFAAGTQSTVQENLCHQNRGAGISFCSGAHSLAQRNTCVDNRFPGISVEDPNTVVTLQENTCCANNDSGILFRNVVDSRAQSNLCRENLWCGIAVRGENTRPMLSANRCNNNGAWGIISWAGADPNLAADNETRDNWKGGIEHRSPRQDEIATARQM